MNTNKKIIADKLSADSKLSQQDAIRFINSFISHKEFPLITF